MNNHPKTNLKNKPSIEESLQRLEFYRDSMALLPAPGDKHPGVAYFLDIGPSGPQRRICDCSTAKNQTCPHILELSQAYKYLAKQSNGPGFFEPFKKSVWYKLASLLADPQDNSHFSIRGQRPAHDSLNNLRILNKQGAELFSYFSPGPDLERFLERCADFLNTSAEETAPRRCEVLKKLQAYGLKDSEYNLRALGLKTRGQAVDESIWYRFAYHGFREFEPIGARFHPFVEEQTGSFMLVCKSREQKNLCRLSIPRHLVKGILHLLKENYPDQPDLAVYPVPLKAIFNISLNTELDLEVRPIIQMIQADGESRFFERQDYEKFRYGDLVYIKELNLLAELEDPDRPRKFKAPVKMVLRKSQIPSFLEEIRAELEQDLHQVDESVRGLRIFKQYERIEIAADTIERDWCWLSLKYGFGNSALSLSEILAAQKEGRRYIATTEGWIDCQAPAFKSLDHLFPRGLQKNATGAVGLSRLELLRWQATVIDNVQWSQENDCSDLLKKILDLKPAKVLPDLQGLTSPLRDYQQRGLEWLVFLQENNLGGLLCDDMGLGKTHQVMALMLYLKKHLDEKKPFLVVCPTTVLSHWQQKLAQHAPDLGVIIYHGGERDLVQALQEHQVLLTSYGVLRLDIEALKQISFSLAVFDETQQIKNPETLAFQAAQEIKACLRIGLTGTPIENNLTDLRALLDLVVPDYLGSDAEFKKQYVDPIQEEQNENRRNELRRLVAPFILRRLKKTVLLELPDKIEDLRLCRLSDDQVKLYRDAIASRSGDLLMALNQEQTPVPYIHIFALLNLLKQICDHPVLPAGKPEDYEQFESGKWDLFKELLLESLGSGQKVVVYSQYLNMIRIIEQYLESLKIGHVVLTGQSRERGAIVSRFSDDPDCRVFVGSLKAGGVGIDLVAASVVIHYDRWWNAAREDQATDRVHRIGQNRGVQVFKLVTEGTLEEKIAAIISRKKKLADSILQEDDPGQLKTFTREELIALLSPPDKERD
jgi:superfamily II DNA or RNA helicase